MTLFLISGYGRLPSFHFLWTCFWSSNWCNIRLQSLRLKSLIASFDLWFRCLTASFSLWLIVDIVRLIRTESLHLLCLSYVFSLQTFQSNKLCSLTSCTAVFCFLYFSSSLFSLACYVWVINLLASSFCTLMVSNFQVVFESFSHLAHNLPWALIFIWGCKVI